MTANTVYDVFLALPDVERQRLVVLVKEYKDKEENRIYKRIKKPRPKPAYTKKEAMDFLLKTVFASKK